MAVVKQAGGIVFRVDGRAISILLVRAKRDPSAWIFPKGHMEKGESEPETALRETREEAGVTGSLVGPVGAPVEFEWRGDTIRVQYFAIRPISESDESDGRAKQWFTFDDAVAHLTYENMRRLLREARPLMEGRDLHGP